MTIWKVTAKRKFDSGVVSFSSGMSIEMQTNTLSTSFWTQAAYRKAIAERFVSEYGLKCPASKFEQQVDNINFEYTLLSNKNNLSHATT